MNKGKKLTQRKIAMKRRKKEREARQKLTAKEWVVGITAILFLLTIIIFIPLLTAIVLTSKGVPVVVAVAIGVAMLLLIIWAIYKLVE